MVMNLVSKLQLVFMDINEKISSPNELESNLAIFWMTPLDRNKFAS